MINWRDIKSEDGIAQDPKKKDEITGKEAVVAVLALLGENSRLSEVMIKKEPGFILKFPGAIIPMLNTLIAGILEVSVRSKTEIRKEVKESIISVLLSCYFGVQAKLGNDTSEIDDIIGVIKDMPYEGYGKKLYSIMAMINKDPNAD